MSIHAKCLIAAVSAFALLLLVPTAGASILGQIDDFEDGTTMGWGGGAATGQTVTNIPTGGPAGANDNYLEWSRTSLPFHLTVSNSSQWAGDYTGVTAIEMDMNALVEPGANGIRLLLLGDGGAFTSSVPQAIASGWNHYSFSLAASDMTRIYGSGSGWTDPGVAMNDLALTLATVDYLLIRNDPFGPTPPGQHPAHVTGAFGVDNIAAVPEPGALLLIAPALGLIAMRIRRKR
jgi:hypothetical protein